MSTPARPRCLVVITSTNQLYSGTGTALFDWIRFARDRIEFVLMIDTFVPRNAIVAAQFCKKYGVRFVPSQPNPIVGAADVGVRDVMPLLARERWDLVECVSWANAATNLEVISAIDPSTRLIFTPHTQPLWTLGDEQKFFATKPTLMRTLGRSDAVFIDSPSELDAFDLPAHVRRRLHYIPLGVDIETFKPNGSLRERAALTVCDFAEHRKRADLLLRAYDAAAGQDASLQVWLAGSGSAVIGVPGSIAERVTRFGYVSLEALIDLYRRAGVFVLLSDFEAFGLPIAEALCCGTPVIINHQPQLVEIFGGLPGVSFINNQDTDAAVKAILGTLDKGISHSVVAEAAAARFNPAAVYGCKLDIVMSML